MTPGAIRPQKTALLVAKRIVETIQREGLGAGGRLPAEAEMLTEYQIGRGTLRESLRYLEFLGIISIKPGPKGGPIVEKPDGQGFGNSITLLLQSEGAPFRTIVEARNGLEPTMAQLAAIRISDDALANLSENLEKMAAGIEDEKVFLELNQEFHELISTASENALFRHLIDALMGILDGSSIGIEYPLSRRKASLKAHRRIYDAIANHDAIAAGEAMSKHIMEYSEYAEANYASALAGPIEWSR